MIFRATTRPLAFVAPLGLIVAVMTGVLVGNWGVLGAMTLVAVLAMGMVFLWPELGFMASIISIVIGQVIRLPIFGDDSAVLINDVLLPAILLAWVLRKLASRRWSMPATSLTTPLILVPVVMGLSLFVNRAAYDPAELMSGTLYFARWVEYLGLLFMGYDMVRTRARAGRYLQGLVWVGLVVSVLGFVQLRVFPDFSFMVPQGWDPHVGRLLSTWYDPNFLAGFLALLTTISLAIALSQSFTRARWWWTAVAIMTVAIIFTFSRSGYLALALGAGLVTLVRSRALFFLGMIGFVIIIFSVPRIQERVVGIRDIDETAKLRLVSWSNAWSVISDHPLLGVGYNTYRTVQVQYGFLEKSSEHSASGSDSSLLTIWVTTGIIGLLCYAWLWGAIFREAWRTWRDRHLPAEWRGYGLGLVAGLAALIIHSQFVNSLFYPHIMQAMWLLVAVGIMVRQPTE